MPRPKNQKHHHWDIDDPHDLLVEARRKTQVLKALHGVTQAEALAWLIDEGYTQLVSPELAGGTVRNRGGGAAPRTANGRAGAAGLRVDGNRYEESGPESAKAA
jgi:hypothetical protein